MNLSSLVKNELPKPPNLRNLIGPSFILLGLGLGSGELILWPYLSANFGLGIIWAAIIGITFQFFLNMEIERYTLATGESIFVGFARKFGNFAPIWFILSTFIPWIWPGIIAASATVLAKAFGFTYSKHLGIILLLLIGFILSIGNVVYKTQEKIQKLIILTGIPFILIITLYLSKIKDWLALLKGLAGMGEGFIFLPSDIPIATFLGALAYAGAGGNLNLAQSLYIKEKGYGMAKYSGKLTNIFRGQKQEVKLEGSTFNTTPENVQIFKSWWKKINIEHAIVFWVTGAFTMTLLSLLAYSSVYGNSKLEKGIDFVLNEAEVIGNSSFKPLSSIFLVVVGIMLFGTQFSVFGSTSRIMAENLVIISKKKFKVQNLSQYFYIFLWLQVISGVVIFSLGFIEPLNLVVTGAVLNAVSMFIYSGLLLILNHTILKTPLKPTITRTLIIFLAFIFYGGFSLYTIYQSFLNK